MLKNFQRNKYKNKKVEIDGVVFDSKKEAKRYQELILMQKAGKISNLECQVKYVLIPTQYSTTELTKAGKPKVAEKECSYVADFVYIENGKTVVEDTKGFRTKEYIIKRKLMLHVYGINITEI